MCWRFHDSAGVFTTPMTNVMVAGAVLSFIVISSLFSFIYWQDDCLVV